MGELSAWHWAVVAVVAILLFGSRRLPDAARSLGQSARILRAELRGGTGGTPATPAPEDARPAAQPPAAQAPAAQTPAAQPPIAQPAGAQPVAERAPAAEPADRG